ncbi:uncharacterized protein ACJ7VT_008839, partial [Polymixia lowei]
PPRLSHSHIPEFSARHPMIPKLYVMPWKHDMKNQRLLLKNAGLAGIPVLPHEESLCLCGRERLCHGQDRTGLSHTSSSSDTYTHTQTGLTAHHSSHFSRYNSSVVTTRHLHQAPPPDTSTRHLHQAPPPDTSTRHLHQAPPPDTSTRHLHQAPPPDTSTRHLHQTPPPDTSTRHLHQTPPPDTSTRHLHQTPPPDTSTRPRRSQR